MASHGKVWCMGYRGRTEGAGSLDEWNHRKPVCLPRDRLLGKPDPAPADDFLFRGSRKVNLLLTVYTYCLLAFRQTFTMALQRINRYNLYYFSERGLAAVPNPKFITSQRPRHHHIYRVLSHGGRTITPWQSREAWAIGTCGSPPTNLKGA